MSRKFKAPIRCTTNSMVTINLDNTSRENCIHNVEDDIVQKSLQELIDKKNREERKANGRLVAIILASLVIFLAIYHAWIRKSSALGGILVPIVIMVSFGAWVVILTRRDRAKRALFEKYLEEIALKKRQELETRRKETSKKEKELYRSAKEIKLHYKNELTKPKYLTNRDINNIDSMAFTKDKKNSNSINRENREHRKHRKRRSIKILTTNHTMYNCTTVKQSGLSRRSSIRQKLFGQNGRYELIAIKKNNKVPLSQLKNVSREKELQLGEYTTLHLKRNRLQRQTAIKVPTMVRTSSIP